MMMMLMMILSSSCFITDCNQTFTTRPSSSSAMAAMCSRLRPALLSLTLCIVLENGNLELCISIFLLASSCC